MVTANGIYRTPARTKPEKVPPPSRRLLLWPLARTNAIFGALFVFCTMWTVARPLLLGPDDRFVPLIERLAEFGPWIVFASPVVLMVLVRRRVVPSWQAFSRGARVGYVAGLLVVQLALLFGAAALTLFLNFSLFGPRYVTSSFGPGLRSAHVYTVGGLSCGYDVYVSQPLSIFAKHTFRLSRATCRESDPKVRWQSPDVVELTDQNGEVLQSQGSPSGCWFGCGGC